MCILRLLPHRVDIRTGRNILFSVLFTEETARLVHGKIRNARRVGTHIRDEAGRTVTTKNNALVELLSDHHRAPRRKPELACRILLQRTGRKRRRGFLPALTALDLLYGKATLCQIVRQSLCFRFVMEGKFFTVCMGHLGGKCMLPLFQLCLDRPVLFGLKRLNLALTVADQTHGNRLDAPCGQPLTYLAPEEGRQLIANDAVQHTACLLGIHLGHVNWPRVMHRLLNRRFCDFVKDDAAVRRRINAKDMRKMPCNCLPLTVRIARQIDFIGILCLFFECTDQIAFPTHINVFRLKVMFHINAKLTFGQIAQMSHRCTNSILFAEVPLDGLCLCRRLHDHQNFFL